MLRSLISLTVISLLLISCGNSGTKDSAVKEEATATSEKVVFDSLVAHPDTYVGKDIVVEGKVVHVCTQSGKKLFIVGQNPDITLFIAAGENMPKFPMELLGSEVTVEGTITKVGGAEIAQAEQTSMGSDAAKTTEGGEKKAEMCETETKLAAQPSLANIVMEYKSHSVK